MLPSRAPSEAPHAKRPRLGDERRAARAVSHHGTGVVRESERPRSVSVQGGGGRDPLELDGRLSFRSYVQYMQDQGLAKDLDTDEAWHEAYKVYKAEHKRRQLWAFFLEHKDQAWFREKYAPDEDQARLRHARRRAGCAGPAAWVRELEDGALDRVSMDLGEERTGGVLYTVTNRAGNKEHFDTEALPIPPDTEHSLLVRAWPPELPRSDLEAHLQTYPGFRYVALLEPIVQRNWQRAGIAVFEEDVDVRAAVSALDGHRFGEFALHLAVVDRPSSSRLRIAPGSTNAPERLAHDLAQARRLVHKLQSEIGDISEAKEALAAIERRVAHLGLDASARPEAAVRIRTDAVQKRAGSRAGLAADRLPLRLLPRPALRLCRGARAPQCVSCAPPGSERRGAERRVVDGPPRQEDCPAPRPRGHRRARGDRQGCVRRTTNAGKRIASSTCTVPRSRRASFSAAC